MGISLLHYRPWRGEFLPAYRSVWPIARVSLGIMFRRKLFWGLYFLGLLVFLMFFFGQYLLAFARSQAAEQTIPVWGMKVRPDDLIPWFQDSLKLKGTPETYRNFFWWQGYMVMAILALAGSLLVGNDFQFGSLPFYLSKPLGRWHYLAGKCLAVSVFVNLLTTVPAVVLFVQYGLLDSYRYFIDSAWLLGGILGYGLILSSGLSVMLVAAATWLRRTVPLIMVWTTVFFFFRLLAGSLVDGLRYDRSWRLIDMWNNFYVVGNACMGLRVERGELIQAALVLGVVSALCLSYLNRRIRAVEVIG